MYDKIAVLDFGSQYTQLIVRKVRTLGAYAEVFPHRFSLEELRTFNPSGVILSGGPASVYAKGSPKVIKHLFDMNIPVLGICYGMHIIAKAFGGTVKKNAVSEYGKTGISVNTRSTLFKDCKKEFNVWMSHSDIVSKLPPDFKLTANTDSTKIAAFENKKKCIFGVQFHPEVAHTRYGTKILKRFVSS